MQRSLRFSFFFRSPTWPTSFSIFSLKVKHSLEQPSFRKSIKALERLPHRFSPRSFSSFNSPHRRISHKGRLIEDLSQYQPPRQITANNDDILKMFRQYNDSFYSAVEEGDMKRVLELVEELKEKKLSIHTGSLKEATRSLVKSKRRTFVKELFQQTEGEDPSLQILSFLLLY